MNSIELVDSFSEFKDVKNIDRPTLMKVLEDIFRTLLRKKYENDENFDIIVNTEKGDQYNADILILTTPVPQTLALIEASHLTFSEDIDITLHAIEYDPCLALMITLHQPSKVPANGGIILDNQPIAWIADNQQKGISALPSVTIHASVLFSKKYLDGDLQEAATLLLKAAETWIPAELVNTWQIHRWRYSLASKRFDKAFLFINQPFPIYFAGDGFGIGNVEGAFLSGWAVSQDIGGL